MSLLRGEIYSLLDRSGRVVLLRQLVYYLFSNILAFGGAFSLNCQHSALSCKTLFGATSYLEGCALVVWCDTAALTRATAKWTCVNAAKGLATGVWTSRWTHVISCHRATPRLPSSR